MPIDNPVLKGFKELFEGVNHKDVVEALRYVESCYDPNTPSHVLSKESVMDILGLCCNFPNSRDFFDRAGPLIDEIIGHLTHLGYRDNIYTYQEHNIAGHTQWIGYAKEPYKPIGIIERQLTIEEADKARFLKKMQKARGEYFDVSDDFIQLSLEPLDAKGNTVCDPRVLDDKLRPLATAYSADFPYRRPHLDKFSK